MPSSVSIDPLIQHQ